MHPVLNRRTPRLALFLALAFALVPVRIAAQSAYTAWQSSFTLTDTPFGKQSALLDNSTHLEWLRLSDTRNKSQLELSRHMANHTDYAGWRFATDDEVIAFFRHFTGSPDGASADPAVEAELQRLMGGPLGHSKVAIGAGTRAYTIGRIAGYTPTNYDQAPRHAGRVQYHYAEISEERTATDTTFTVAPWKTGYNDGDVYSSDTGTFLVREY